MDNTLDLTILGTNLKKLAASRGLNQKDLAAELNITTPTLSRYMSGLRTPELPVLIKFADYFGVSLDWLLGLNDDRYAKLPADIQEMAELYSVASEDDRRVVQAVLNKYREVK